MTPYLYAFVCVIGLTVGQLLFKSAATAWSNSTTVMDASVLLPILAAMALYGVTSLGWVWILRRIELGRVYPVMAAAFILVPLGSHFVFGERFSAQYCLGAGLIALGISVIAGA